MAVSSDGATAVIGADGDEDPNGEESGSAYVFEAVDGSWTQRAKLTTDDGAEFDALGYSVGLPGDGTTAVVSCYQTDPDTRGTGSAYVFDGSGASWNQRAKLVDDATSGEKFGSAVATSSDGTTALVGDMMDLDTDHGGRGSAYVFTP